MFSDDLGTLVPSNSPDQLNRHVLHQHRWWFDRHARAHLIDEMPAAYRSNLLRFLWLQRRDLHAFDSLATVMVEDLAEIEQVLARGSHGLLPHQLGVEGWFAGLPLVARLVQLTGGVPGTFADGNPGHEVSATVVSLMHRPRAALLASGWPILQRRLAALGATPSDQAELCDHVRDACQAVMDHT